MVWRKCESDGLIVSRLGVLDNDLSKVWQPAQPHVPVRQLRDWFAQYPYLSKLREPQVLARAISEALARADAKYAIADRLDDHRCRAIFASAAISADTVAGSAAPAIRTRAPPANSISIMGAADAAAAPGTIATSEKPAAAPAGPHNCCRQRNSWLVWIPAARATSDTTAPGSKVAAMIRSFSARDHRRRRCTDVITSTEPFVIGLSLGLVL